MRYALRRLLIIPLMLVLAAVILALLPVVAAGQVIVSALRVLRGHPPRWRALRLLAFAAVYSASECASVLACLLLWLASPVPRWRDDDRWRARHIRVLGGFLGTLLRTAQPIFGFRLKLENPRGAPLPPSRPLIVLGRHAGPGASFVLIHVLLSERQRVPRVVLKSQLRLDPALDILLTRIGCAFIGRGGTGPASPAAAVAELAADLRPRDAMVIFPEGRDWTPARHRLAVRRLRRKGLSTQATAAAAMPNVLPPRPAPPGPSRRSRQPPGPSWQCSCTPAMTTYSTPPRSGEPYRCSESSTWSGGTSPNRRSPPRSNALPGSMMSGARSIPGSKNRPRSPN